MLIITTYPLIRLIVHIISGVLIAGLIYLGIAEFAGSLSRIAGTWLTPTPIISTAVPPIDNPSSR